MEQFIIHSTVISAALDEALRKLGSWNTELSVRRKRHHGRNDEFGVDELHGRIDGGDAYSKTMIDEN